MLIENNPDALVSGFFILVSFNIVRYFMRMSVASILF